VNQDQISGILRVVVPALCTWFAAKGLSWFGDEGVQAQLAAVVVGIAALVWSYFSHTNANKLRAAAAINPDIKIDVPTHVVTADPSLAKVVDDDKVRNVNEIA
jgi:hypothetical protein